MRIIIAFKKETSEGIQIKKYLDITLEDLNKFQPFVLDSQIISKYSEEGFSTFLFTSYLR